MGNWTLIHISDHSYMNFELYCWFSNFIELLVLQGISFLCRAFIAIIKHNSGTDEENMTLTTSTLINIIKTKQFFDNFLRIKDLQKKIYIYLSIEFNKSPPVNIFVILNRKK